MARRRRSNVSKSSKKTEVVPEENGIDKNITTSKNNISHDTVNTSDNSKNDVPIVHKKFGPIRVSPSNNGEVNGATSYNANLENDLNYILQKRNKMKVASVYNAENDIPLDGSVIIKPGAFNMNAINLSTNVNSPAHTLISNNVDRPNFDFMKVIEKIEMLQKINDYSFLKNETNVDSINNFTAEPMDISPVIDNHLNGEEDKRQCFEEEDMKTEMCSSKTENVGDISLPQVCDDKNKNDNHEKEEIIDELEGKENLKKIYASDLQSLGLNCQVSLQRLSVENTVSKDKSDSENNSSPLQVNFETPSPPCGKSSPKKEEILDAADKLQQISIEETDNSQPTSESSISKASDELLIKKDKSDGSDSASSNSAIRRSTRIRSQKPRQRKTVTGEKVKSEGGVNKPVKVKSRWRRSSEMDTKRAENVQSPPNIPLPPSPSPMTAEEKEAMLQKEAKDVTEGLSTFTQLEVNDYKMERNSCKDTKGMDCDCFLTKEEIVKKEVGCGEDCLNRMLFIECGPRCALGDRCSNKRFQLRTYADCKIFKTEMKGFGLKAEKALPGNTFIMEYVGEVVNPKEFARRTKAYAKDNNRHFYFMALKADTIIDATMKGNISRFINHSCDPNAETQKWTVNNELRVGFFTRRPVSAGEEITFDYQFQLYGKAAQKCFCGSPLCRGWIGKGPDESEDEEEDEVEEESEESEDEEQEEEKKEEEKEEMEKKEIEVKLPTELKKEIEIEEKISIPVKPKKIKTSEKKKKADRETKNIIDDFDLEGEVQKLMKTGLKNRAHTLTLSRLMVRTEDWSTRLQLLKLIREADSACRRLFLDYHGIRLIASWMASTDLVDCQDIQDRNTRCLQILSTLHMLPIPHKTMLVDSKVLPTVEAWSKSCPAPIITRTPLLEEDQNSDEVQKPKGDIPFLDLDTEDQTPSGVENEKQIVDQAPLEVGDKEAVDQTIAENGRKVDKNGAWTVTQLAAIVLQTWSSLKEGFKIPKKERLEEMKEHEREADRGYKEYLEHRDSIRERYGSRPMTAIGPIPTRYSRKRSRDSPPEVDWFHNRHLSKLSKVERRQLFAMKVAQEDEETRKRHEEHERWNQHKSKCLALGLDPNTHSAIDPVTGYPLFYDHNTGTWQHCPPAPTPMFNGPPMITPDGRPIMSPMIGPDGRPILGPDGIPIMGSPMIGPDGRPILTPDGIPIMGSPIIGPDGRPMIGPDGIPIMGTPMIGPDGRPILGPDGMPIMGPPVISPDGRPLIYPPSDLYPPGSIIQSPQCHYQYPEPSLPPQYNPPLMYPESSFPITYANEQIQPEIPPESIPLPAEIPPNPPPVQVPLKLPPKWKSAKDSKGRTYYYHVKDRVSQWEPPQWSEEDARAEAARALAAEIEDESSSSSESSESSSEEDEVEEEDNNTNNDAETAEAESTEKPEEEEEVTETKKEGEKEEKEVSSPELCTTSIENLVIDADKEEEELSGWEDEEVQPTSTQIIPKPTRRREGLVQEIIISPRREEDRIDQRKFKETKLMLRRQKEEQKAKMKLKAERAKMKLKRNNKIKGSGSKEKPTSAAADTSSYRKIKENFKNDIADAIKSHLNAYRKQDCKKGRITNSEDFKYLARKLTHTVFMKEEGRRSVDALQCGDSIKEKTKDYIKKYMVKYGPVYSRPPNEDEF